MKKIEQNKLKAIGIALISVITIVALVAILDSTFESNTLKYSVYSSIQSVIINAAIFYFFNKTDIKGYLISVTFLGVSIYFMVFHFLDFFIGKSKPDYYALFIPISWILCGLFYLFLLKLIFKISNVKKTILVASLLYLPFSFYGIIVYDIAFIISWNLITLIVFMWHLKFPDIS